MGMKYWNVRTNVWRYGNQSTEMWEPKYWNVGMGMWEPEYWKCGTSIEMGMREPQYENVGIGIWVWEHKNHSMGCGIKV